MRVICISHTEREKGEGGCRDIPSAAKCAGNGDHQKRFAPAPTLPQFVAGNGDLLRLRLRRRLRFVEPLKSLIENILSVFLYVILWSCRLEEEWGVGSREQGEGRL